MSQKIDPAAAALAAALQKWARSPLLMASGAGGDLKVLVEYLGAQQRRLEEWEERLKALEKAARLRQWSV